MPNQKKKILHVVEPLGAGVLSSVSQICNGLAGQGHEIYLAYSVRDMTPDRLRQCFDPRVTMHHLPMDRDIHPLKDAVAFFRLLLFVIKIKPDVIHLHSSKAGFIGRAVAFCLRKNTHTFYSPHGISFLHKNISSRKQLIFLMLERLAHRWFGGQVVAVSNSERMEIMRHISKHRILLLENAVDIQMIPQRSKRSDNLIQVGISGLVTAAKNPALFIKLAKRLQTHGMVFNWIGGKGENPEDIKRLEESGVKISGWLNHTDALNKMAELDIYLQTSLWEGMPIAVLEAMAIGLPVVVTDIGGNRDVVEHGVTGFIGHDELTLAKYLECLGNNLDLRIQMGKQARITAATRFSIKRLIQDAENMYGI